MIFIKKIKNFKDKYRTFKYLQLTPEIISAQKDFNEIFFNKIDEIENEILDGKSFTEITSPYQKDIEKVPFINFKKIDKQGNVFQIDLNLLKEIFKINDFSSPSFLTFKNKFYIVEITGEESDYLDINNKSVKDLINKQINLVKMLEENSKIVKRIQNNNFGQNEINELLKNNVDIEKPITKNINDFSKFDEDIVRQIYNYKSGQIFIVTDFPKAEKNFLVQINKQTDPIINSESKIYKKYIEKANKQYISKVYKSYDSYINSIYKININEKVFERIINSI